MKPASAKYSGCDMLIMLNTASFKKDFNCIIPWEFGGMYCFVLTLSLLSVFPWSTWFTSPYLHLCIFFPRRDQCMLPKHSCMCVFPLKHDQNEKRHTLLLTEFSLLAAKTYQSYMTMRGLCCIRYGLDLQFFLHSVTTTVGLYVQVPCCA